MEDAEENGGLKGERERGAQRPSKAGSSSTTCTRTKEEQRFRKQGGRKSVNSMYEAREIGR